MACFDRRLYSIGCGYVPLFFWTQFCWTQFHWPLALGAIGVQVHPRECCVPRLEASTDRACPTCRRIDTVAKPLDVGVLQRPTTSIVPRFKIWAPGSGNGLQEKFHQHPTNRVTGHKGAQQTSLLPRLVAVIILPFSLLNGHRCAFVLVTISLAYIDQG